MLHCFSVMRFENLLQQIFKILCGNLNEFFVICEAAIQICMKFFPICYFLANQNNSDKEK